MNELEIALEQAYRQNLAYHQMLAHALEKLGGELRINQEDLVNGKFDGVVVDLSEDMQASQFVLRLVKPNDA